MTYTLSQIRKFRAGMLSTIPPYQILEFAESLVDRHSTNRIARFILWLGRNDSVWAITECPDCKSLVWSDETECTSNHGNCLYVCRDCYASNYFCCESCDTSLSSDEYAGEGQCTDCYNESEPEENESEPEESESGSGTSGVYSADASPLYYTPITNHFLCHHEKTNSGTLFQGWELEVQVRSNFSNSIRAINAAFDKRGICKIDRSLSSHGVELVSNPMTLAYHQNNWTEFLSVVRDKATGYGNDSYGMHVHMSRAALLPLQIGRMTVFLNGDHNGLDNSGFIRRIAGRSGNQFCEYARTSLKNSRPYFLSQNVRLDDYLRSGKENVRARFSRIAPYHGNSFNPALLVWSDNRYRPLNLNNEKTIEIRIFQANCATAGFLKNLEFCHALAMFALDTSNRELRAMDFCTWMNDSAHRGQYPNLYEFLADAALVPQTKKPKPDEQASLPLPKPKRASDAIDRLKMQCAVFEHGINDPYITDFIKEYSTVQREHIERNLNRGITYVLRDSNNTLVAVCTLKNPDSGYRTGVGSNHNVHLGSMRELGYLTTAPEHRRKGLMAALVRRITSDYPQSMYATTFFSEVVTLLAQNGNGFELRSAKRDDETNRTQYLMVRIVREPETAIPVHANKWRA